MNRSTAELRNDALAIWQAGVAAVRADQLVLDHVRVDGPYLIMADESIALRDIRRILVVGAGKAGAGMVQGLEVALGPALLAEKEVVGWVNVPEDCAGESGRTPAIDAAGLPRIKLHGARPSGVNEPTAAGVFGTEQILRLVQSADPRDLCLCLISGGGSALLPAPVAGVSLADKQAIARHLGAAGANIRELNTVRKQLSRVKGGGLARACHAGRLVSLVISDVLGDPLDIIASGPTVADPSSPQEALEILRKFDARRSLISPAVFNYLEAAAREGTPAARQPTCRTMNLVIGNNAVAVDGAGAEAVRRGYSPAMHAARELEGTAEEVGRGLAEMARLMRAQPGPDCLITGGEPVVKLVPAEQRGIGGRNQQLVLAALAELISHHDAAAVDAVRDLVLLSGGTDGEDGPTDAAGAWIDRETVPGMLARRLDPNSYLRRNDAYRFFEPLGGLIKSGPTHTNVCDVRVVVVSRP